MKKTLVFKFHEQNVLKLDNLLAKLNHSLFSFENKY